MIPDTKGTSRAVWPLAGQFVKEKECTNTWKQHFALYFFFFFLAVFFGTRFFLLLSVALFLFGPMYLISAATWSLVDMSLFRMLIYNWMDNDRANLCGQQMP